MSHYPFDSARGMSSSIAIDEPDELLDDEAVDDSSETPVDSKPGRYAIPSRPSRAKWWVIGGIIAAVLVVGLVLLLTLRKPAAPTTSTRTQEFKAAMTTMDTTVGASGTIEPAQRADLTFSSAGTVAALNVAVGDAVKAGQALAAIDLTDLQSAVDQAQAAVTAAQDDYNTAVSGGDSTKINAAKSTLTTKQNALDNANTALANGTLTAPFDGTVAIVNMAVGDKVGSASAGGGGGANQYSNSNANSSTTTDSITVITSDTYQVTTSVGSADVGSLQKGQNCTVTPNGTRDRLPGTVTSVGVIATSTTSAGASFPVTIAITGPQKGLYAGVGASVSIVTSSRTVLAVPTAAITRGPGGDHVQLKTADGVTDTVIQTGATSGGMTEVTSGLKEGDTVEITITISGGASAGPGGFSTMFGNGNGQRQRPTDMPTGGYATRGDFPGGFPSDGNFQGGPGGQPTP